MAANRRSSSHLSDDMDVHNPHLEARNSRTSSIRTQQSIMSGLSDHRNMDTDIFNDPYDMSAAQFNPDLYMNKLLKEQNLSELMDTETLLYRQIKSLDSEMQTLVYENYNKFISATQTIKKMSTNFDKMEQELNSLSEKIENITSESEDVSTGLRNRRTELNKLSTTHTTLQKLHFLFELGPKMAALIDDKKYSDAVKHYLKSEKALNQYKHYPSISNIDQEVKDLLLKLKEKLHEHFLSMDTVTIEEMTSSVQLLLQLKENPNFMAFRFLKFSAKKLEQKISELDYYIQENQKLINKSGLKAVSEDDAVDEIPMDILEFVDMACNGFLTILSQIIMSFDKMFLNQNATKQLATSSHVPLDENQQRDAINTFVDQNIKDFMERIKKRLDQEKSSSAHVNPSQGLSPGTGPSPTGDMKFLVRAMDRFHRRLAGIKKVYSVRDFTAETMAIIKDVMDSQLNGSLDLLKESFDGEITSVRHIIASSDETVEEPTGHEGPESTTASSSDLLSTIESVLNDSVKGCLSSLESFISTEVNFMKDFGTKFHDDFVRDVRERVIVTFFHHVLNSCQEYQRTGSNWTSPSQLILILSRLCYDMESNIISYLINYSDELLNTKTIKIGPSTGLRLTTVSELTSDAKSVAQKLINHYVKLEGYTISSMIRKSIESKSIDWSSSIEPSSVRSVMKRMVNDIQKMDASVAELYEEGSRNAKSGSGSSKSRRTFSNYVGFTAIMDRTHR